MARDPWYRVLHSRDISRDWRHLIKRLIGPYFPGQGVSTNQIRAYN